MKNLFIYTIITFLLFISSVNAAVLFVTERVRYVTTYASSSSDQDWITLENLTSLGSCGVSSNGYPLLRLKDNDLANRQLAVAITAKIGGISVNISVDESVKDSSGYCYLRSIILL